MNNIDKLKMDNVKLKMKNENNLDIILISQIKVEWKTLGKLENSTEDYPGKANLILKMGTLSMFRIKTFFLILM